MNPSRRLAKEDIILLNSYLLTYLSERDQVVLRTKFSDRMRWGPKGKFTYEDVGRIIGVSRERARQITMRALYRLRILELERQEKRKSDSRIPMMPHSEERPGLVTPKITEES